MGRWSGNTFRTTISVPIALKEQMDALGANVNWSDVACRAFEQKLTEISSERKVKSMNDVIQRLRASKQQHLDEKYREGKTFGELWVKEWATVKQLEGLEEFVRGDHWGEIFEGGSTFTFGDLVLQRIDPDQFGTSRTEEFWENHFGNEKGYELSSHEPFIRGLVDGAMDVWNAVKDKVSPPTTRLDEETRRNEKTVDGSKQVLKAHSRKSKE